MFTINTCTLCLHIYILIPIVLIINALTTVRPYFLHVHFIISVVQNIEAGV